MKDEHKKRKKDDDDYHSGKHKKSENSGYGSNKSNKLPHYPMSERQQYALLRQMDDDNSSVGIVRETSETSSNISGHSNDSPSYVSDRKLNKRNGAGETLLIQMAKKGDLSAIKGLIGDGANVNEQDYAGWTALHECSIRNYPQIAQYLLQHDADVNLIGLHGDTALHDAVRNGCVDVVRLLLRYGADSRRRNDKGIRPLDLAQSDEIKKMLIHHYSEMSNSYKEKRIKLSRESTSESKQDLPVKDPYAFEDEEGDSCKLPTPKSNKSKKINILEDTLHVKDIKSSSSNNHLSPTLSESRSNSPKVPPLRIKIGGSHSSGNEDASNNTDDTPKKIISSDKQVGLSDSDSSILSTEGVPTKSSDNNNSTQFSDQPNTIMKSEIKSESTINSITRDDDQNVFDTHNQVNIKEEMVTQLKEEHNILSPIEKYASSVSQQPGTSSNKRTSGRTLRSHTNAATTTTSTQIKDKEDKNNDRAPIKKRKFKRNDILNSDRLNSKTDDQSRHSGNDTSSINNANTNNESSSSAGDHDQMLPSTHSDDIDDNDSTYDQIIMSSVNNTTGIVSGSNNNSINQPMEIWHNPYKRAIRLHKRLDALFCHELVHPKPPIGYKDFLLNCTGQYLLGSVENSTSSLSNNISTIRSGGVGLRKRQVPSDIKRSELIALFDDQELYRYNQTLKHQSEREHLRITAEQEVIRAHSKAARQLAGHDRPYSFCSVIAYKNYTYIPNTTIKHVDSNPNSIKIPQKFPNDQQKFEKFSSEEFIKLLKSVKMKYENEKRNMLNRQLHESESLMMVQKMDWELKLRDLQLEDIHGDPFLLHMNVDHVPMTDVPQDFVLFSTDPFQILGCVSL